MDCIFNLIFVSCSKELAGIVQIDWINAFGLFVFDRIDFIFLIYIDFIYLLGSFGVECKDSS